MSSFHMCINSILEYGIIGLQMGVKMCVHTYMMYLFIFEWDVKMCYTWYCTVVESVMEYGEEDGIFNAV